MSQLLVIFDLDGTLVDSELLCNQAFLDLLPSLCETTEELVDQFRGKKLSEILLEIEHKLSYSLPDGFEITYRRRVAELFASHLTPVEGVPEMLQTIEYPYCIASSGPPEKIEHALTVTGLAQFFCGRCFSSYTVGSWKPDPGLFLHAAAAMGFAPSSCVVVEDSPTGLEAAKAAGMHRLHYAPGLDTARNAVQFRHMSDLPAILHSIEIASAH
ncbi:HAD family hydrolase [Niveibacterium sp. COAC-50]|uniref:HAD family hydrolase n=1 Tax=Niveibacterium sp. COAC-50 TaxID=2729384 RepID=UPI00155228F1|nr:HAD family hydrolase [Niveibacterium sp. COAC-50]